MSAIVHLLPLGWTTRLALLRLATHWRSLLTIIIGVFLAAIVGANAPLYSAAVAQLGMVQRIKQQSANKTNIDIALAAAGQDTHLDALWASLDSSVRQSIRDQFDANWPGWVDQTAAWGETAPMFAIHDGSDIPNTKLRVAYYENWTDRVSVIAGTLPTEAADGSFEAAMLVDSATTLGIHVGDVITLDQRGWDTSIPVTARITALITPTDPSSAYWMPPSPLRIDANGESNLLTTKTSFLHVAQKFVPQTKSQLGWRILFDPSQLAYSTIPDAVVRLNDFRSSLTTQLKSQNLDTIYTSQLASILSQYFTEIGYLNAPFGLLLLQVGALVLFFLVVMVALVRRGERREIAMLQSRGAFDRQIMLLRGIEALMICGVAALTAPFIARQILIWAAPLFAGLPHLPLVLDGTPFLYSTAAATLALIVLIATLRPVLRLPLIMAGGSASRGDRHPWWQRYYLDVVLLVVGSAALFRLVTTDSPLTQTAVGGTTADPLLLIAPALLFVALGSITLRLFPTMADAAARFFSKRRELTGALATWQVSREPSHYGRITFLLALAIGVGWFATSFQATIAHSQSDQANYAVGADLRLSEHDNRFDEDRVQPNNVYAAQPNVAAASDALRMDEINFSLSGTSIEKGTILAVDPTTFASTASWRSDLGTLPLPATLDLSQTGAALPSVPQRIGLWVRVQQHLKPNKVQDAGQLIPIIEYVIDSMNFWVRLRDSSGTYQNVPLIKVSVQGVPDDTDISQFVLNVNPFMDMVQYDAEVQRLSDLTKNLSGWIYLEGVLPFAPQGDTRLDTIYWRSTDQDAQYNFSAGTGATERILTLSNFTLVDSNDRATRFNILGDSGWETLLEDDKSAAISSAKDADHAGGRVITWTQKTGQMLGGIILNYPALDAIPAIVSKPFADENNLLSGATFDLFSQRQRVHFEVQGSTNYYPTLYAQQSPFLIADQSALLYMLNRRLGAAIYLNEAWIRLASGVSARDFLQQARLSALDNNRLVTQTQTLDDALERLRSDALSLGLAGLLFIAFAVALALSVTSLLTYTALTLQSRRNELAVLRTLGFASSQLIASIALEQILVFVTAVLLGAVLGFLLSERVLPTLAFNTSGVTITPPFIVQVEAPVLLQYGLVLLLVLAVVLIGSLLLVRRISLAQALRYGEE